MSISAFLNISFEPQLRQLIDIISKGNNFHKSFEQFGGLGLSSGSFSIQKPYQLLNGQLCQHFSVQIFFTIKNGLILLYFHFNKIIKVPGTSLQSPALGKNMLEMFFIQHTSIKHKCNFHFVAMPMMMSQILKSMNFTKMQKSRHFENEILFFLQLKKN